MTNESDQFYADAAVAGALGAGLGALAHMSLWDAVKHMDMRDPLAPLFGYGLGVSCIVLPFAALMYRHKMGRAVAGLGFCIGGVGASVAALRLYRKWLELDRGVARSNGRARGLIKGAHLYGETYRAAAAGD